MMRWLMGTTLEHLRQQRELLERGQAIREAREAEAERRRLRDKFAAAALTGLLAAEKDGSLCNDVVAKYAYKRLPEVLAHHGDTIAVLHTLRPIGVAMSGASEVDPYKD